MKKIKAFLALAFILALILSNAPNVLAAQLDASNETGSVSLLTIGNHSKVAQTFKPTLPTLNSISVYLGNGDGSVTLRLIKVSSGETIYGEAKGIGAWTWYTFTPGAGSVPVNAGEDYEINISAGAASTTQWKLGTNGYANGMAYYPDAVADQDFYFRTYGTPASAPSATPSASPSSSPGSGVIGSAPAKTTDPAIKPATELKAEDVSDREKDTPKVKLTWTASTTTTIDGYRVYGKSDPAADYALVAEVKKDIKEYTDTKVEFDKEYAYMVRAYKTAKESESSNEVRITPRKEARELKNFGFLNSAGPLWKQWQFWTLIGLVLALIGFVIWYVIDRKKRKLAQGNDMTIKS